VAQLSVMLDRVHDELPAVPEPVALRALADSVKEFCKRSHIWQEDLPAVRTRVGVTNFDLAPDTGTIVVAVKEVRLAGERIPPAPKELSQILTNTLPSAAKPAAWMQVSPNQIQLLNATEAVELLTVRAAITLAQGQTEIELPDDLVDEYAEDLAAGAKGRLVMQRGQPWYAPEAAGDYRRQYYVAVNQAKFRAMTSLGQADLSVQMRSW
jgi:hypothetical protein